MAKTQKVWGPFYGRMAEKTVLHRLLKRLPRMPGDPPDFDEVEQEPEPAQPTIVGPLPGVREAAQVAGIDPDEMPQVTATTETLSVEVPMVQASAQNAEDVVVQPGQPLALRPVDDEAASRAFDGQGGDDDSPF